MTCRAPVEGVEGANISTVYARACTRVRALTADKGRPSTPSTMGQFPGVSGRPSLPASDTPRGEDPRKIRLGTGTGGGMDFLQRQIEIRGAHHD